MARKKEPALLWNERGQIGCTLPGHAPHKGSDSWEFEHWMKIPEGTLKPDGGNYVCEVCDANRRSDDAARASTALRDDSGPANPTVVPTPEPEKKKGKRAKGDLTLSDLAEKYLAHMETDGKSSGTVFSYRLELQTALTHLGADTKLADLKPEQVMLFFGSEKVNKTRTGKPKSPLSIAKTQRVLRQALVWAAEKRLIEKAPLPENLATH